MRILRVVAGEGRSCGCLFGIYETYDGDIVRIVDAQGKHCKTHRLGQRLDWSESHSPETADFVAPSGRG